MSYYPTWFDYAGWLFGGAGAICAWMMASEPIGQRRGYLKLTACLLIAIGLGFAATGGVLFNLRAPHITARGVVFNVVRHSGRNSSTAFRLRVPSGEIDNLSLSSAIDQIDDGEIADVQYQARSNAVLDISIVGGRYEGFERTGSDGLTGAGFLLVGAVVLAIYGVINWLSDGTAIASAPDDRNAPDGDVDSKSMLNLSSHD